MNTKEVGWIISPYLILILGYLATSVCVENCSESKYIICVLFMIFAVLISLGIAIYVIVSALISGKKWYKIFFLIPILFIIIYLVLSVYV